MDTTNKQTPVLVSDKYSPPQHPRALGLLSLLKLNIFSFGSVARSKQDNERLLEQQRPSAHCGSLIKLPLFISGRELGPESLQLKLRHRGLKEQYVVLERTVYTQNVGARTLFGAGKVAGSAT